jgi:TorA maturation chaperone TorD
VETFGLPGPQAHEHTEVFGLQLYPYASVYVGPEGMLGGEARDRIAGFWRVLRLTPATEPDHLATLL